MVKVNCFRVVDIIGGATLSRASSDIINQYHQMKMIRHKTPTEPEHMRGLHTNTFAALIIKH